MRSPPIEAFLAMILLVRDKGKE